MILLLACTICMFAAHAQTDTVVMNDGRQIPCRITSSDYNYLGVTKDSVDYLISKKYVNRYVLTSPTQPSLMIKNMDYEHSLNNPKYMDKGHSLAPLKYIDPLSTAGHSLVATGFMWIVGGIVTGTGARLGSAPVLYTGIAIVGGSVIPLILAGSKLAQASNRHKKIRFIQ